MQKPPVKKRHTTTPNGILFISFDWNSFRNLVWLKSVEIGNGKGTDPQQGHQVYTKLTLYQVRIIRGYGNTLSEGWKLYLLNY